MIKTLTCDSSVADLYMNRLNRSNCRVTGSWTVDGKTTITYFRIVTIATKTFKSSVAWENLSKNNTGDI